MERPNPEFLTYAARGKTAWWRYLIVCVSACAVATVVLVAVTLALMRARVFGPHTIANVQHPTDPAAFFLWVAATFGALIVGLAASAALFQRKRPTDIVGNWRWQLFAAGFGIWTLVQIGAVVIDYLLVPHGFSVTLSHATAGLAGFAAIGLIVQTFAEEFIFRGYLTQGIFLALKRPIPASILSGLLFGALHIPNGIASSQASSSDVPVKSRVLRARTARSGATGVP